jgi:hypothetical protein
MKTGRILILILIAGSLVFSGCSSENKELKKDAVNIADAMCKSIEAMKNLQTADPADSVQIQRLQADYKKIEAEMTALNDEFRKKYVGNVNSKEFTDQFRKYLNEAMLDCKSLSKEDRAVFEKGAK